MDEIAKAFKIKDLIKTITRPKSGYIENVHYRPFDISTGRSGVNYTKAPARKDTHYFTYAGLGRALFTCSSKTAAPFLSWAIDVLFTAHLGTPSQREELASTLTGISLEGVKNLCRVTSGITSCVYLIAFSTVKKLRKSMKIGKEYKDDCIVGKFGRTNDLARRIREHANKYTMAGTRIELLYFGRVDIKYASKAEAEIAAVFDSCDMSFKYNNSKEIVIIPPKKLSAIKKAYDVYTEHNLGRVRELSLEVQKKDVEIYKLNAAHEIEMLKLKQELKDAEHDAKDAKRELEHVKLAQELKDAKHEAEILRYQLAAK
jgi:hypothetical protein